jgi:threonine/homoserine/homoserine lactone efflux protein
MPELLAAAALAGFVYGISPGPAVLALLGLSADRGRGAAIAFVAGLLAGDALWAALALVAILGAQTVGTLVFDLLGLACGGYLLWLGWGALRARPRGAEAAPAAPRPLLRGLLLGLTNPKGYPVAVATFTALLSSRAALLHWSLLPALVLAAVGGAFLAYGILVALCGMAPVRRFYRRHEPWIVRASGLVFIGFALHALAQALPGLAGQKG